MTQTLATKAAFEKPDWYLGPRAHNIRIRAEVVEAFVQGLTLEDILDIGCGSGEISLPLLTRHNRLTLLDLSAGMLSIARANVPSEMAGQVKTVHAGFMDASLEPGSYDLIICVGVIAYIEELEPFVAKLASLLRPGGMVIAECTNAHHPLSYLTLAYERCRRWFGQRQVPLVLRSSWSVLKTFEARGFELVNSYQYSLPLPVIQRCFNQNFHYQTIRFFYGSAAKGRNSRFGNECIFKFVNKVLVGIGSLLAAWLESQRIVA